MNAWNPWKVTAIAMGLVMATALVTGLVVANWTGTDRDRKTEALKAPAPAADTPTKAALRPSTPARTVTAQAPGTPAVPTQAAVAACNQWAAQQAGSRDKTVDTVKDAGIGALVGAAVGAAGGAIADGGKGAGKGAAIGGVLGAGGGTLYGLNENKKHDENYRAAYASCMRSRGYTS
jgi:hypothetical protein